MGLKDLFNRIKGKVAKEQNSEDLLKAEIAELESYTTPKGYVMEERIKQDPAFSKLKEYGQSFGIMLLTYGYGEEKLPTNYFFNKIARRIDNPITRSSLASDHFIDILCKQAKPFYIDKDGETQDRTNKLSSEDIISSTNNPVLEFVYKFNFYEFKTDIDGEDVDKLAVYIDIINFLALYSGIDEAIPINKDILKENPWILDKQTYFNKLGIVKDKNSFLKDCYKISGNKYFELMLDRN